MISYADQLKQSQKFSDKLQRNSLSIKSDLSRLTLHLHERMKLINEFTQVQSPQMRRYYASKAEFFSVCVSKLQQICDSLQQVKPFQQKEHANQLLRLLCDRQLDKQLAVQRNCQIAQNCSKFEAFKADLVTQQDMAYFNAFITIFDEFSDQLAKIKLQIQQLSAYTARVEIAQKFIDLDIGDYQLNQLCGLDKQRQVKGSVNVNASAGNAKITDQQLSAQKSSNNEQRNNVVRQEAPQLIELGQKQEQSRVSYNAQQHSNPIQQNSASLRNIQQSLPIMLIDEAPDQKRSGLSTLDTQDKEKDVKLQQLENQYEKIRKELVISGALK